MRKVINGIKIVKNKASLYVNGRMQYQAINLIAEYGTELNGCRYAVTSKYPQWKMEKRFAESLDKFRPYIFLTSKEYEPIRESQNNDTKFRMRSINCHDPYGYTGELTEILHDCEIICADTESDPLTAIIEKEEIAELDRYKSKLTAAMDCLTSVQKRRITMYFYDNKTLREIAEIEKADVRAVWESIDGALKRMKKYFKKF